MLVHRISGLGLSLFHLEKVNVNIESTPPIIADWIHEFLVSFTQDALLRIGEALAIRILFTVGGSEYDDGLT